MRRIFLQLANFALLGAIFTLGCGGGNSAANSSTISILISPLSASLAAGAQQQFTATVTGSSNTAVTWQVNGMAGGNATVGTITASGLYTAPGSAPSTAITITAVSAANPADSASVSVTIVAASIAVTVAPSSAILAPSQQQQFTATVTGSSNTAVTWQVNGARGGNATVGTITASGLYTAPGSAPSTAITITAVSAANSADSASASVTVSSSSPIPDPLGTATGSGIACASGGVAGQCWRLTVSCPGVADNQPAIKVTTPATTAVGTIIFAVGNGGTGWYDQFYQQGTTIINNVVAAGFTAVQINFNDGAQGWLTGPGGPRKLACRFATAAEWIYTNIHQGGTAAPLCATGNSGGSGLIAYALAHYGMGSILAMVEPTSGPPFGRIDWGCLGTSPAITMGADACGQTLSPTYPSEIASSLLDTAYGNNTCSTQQSSAAGTFLNDSIMSPQTALSYPATDVHVLYGSLDTSSAVPQGWEWSSAIQSKHTISCVAGAPHGIPDTTQGATQISNDLINFCHLQ
jgi:hypothetical protein